MGVVNGTDLTEIRRAIILTVLTDSATVLRPTRSASTVGTVDVTYEPVGTWPASVGPGGVGPVRAQTTTAGSQIGTTATASILFSYDADVLEGDRVQIGGAIWQVLGVEARETLRLAIETIVVEVR